MKLCTFKGNESPCVAEVKADSPRQYCGPHEQMLAHDYALAFRRRVSKDKAQAEAWAHRHGLNLDVLAAAASKLTDRTKPLTVRTVGDVDSL